MVVNGNIADHVSSVVHKLLDRCRSFVVASRPSVSLEEERTARREIQDLTAGVCKLSV